MNNKIKDWGILIIGSLIIGGIMAGGTFFVYKEGRDKYFECKIENVQLYFGCMKEIERVANECAKKTRRPNL